MVNPRPRSFFQFVRIVGALALVGALAAGLFATVRTAHATGWVVNTLGDATNGSCASTCTLRDAMTLAASGDTITFSVSGTIMLGSTLPTVSKVLTIDGTGQSVTISGNNSVQIIVVNSGGTLSLNAMTLSNGNLSTCCGGGAVLNNGTLNVTNDTFSANSSNGGGAIFNGSTLNVMNSSHFTESYGNEFGVGCPPGALRTGLFGIRPATPLCRHVWRYFSTWRGRKRAACVGVLASSSKAFGMALRMRL